VRRSSVTIVTSAGSVTLDADDFMPSDARLSKDVRLSTVGLFGSNFTDAQISVSSRLMDIPRRDSTLHIRFGDPNSDAFGFTTDLAPAKRKIIDFAESCR
jgi:hypothetical protein